MPALMVHPKSGALIPKDKSAFEIVLCCHGATPGGAWIVSRVPDATRTAAPEDGGKFYIPQAWVDRSEALGGFERMDMRTCQRVLITAHEFSMPHYRAVLKGLAP